MLKTLDKNQLHVYLKDHVKHIILLNEVDSTNDFLKRLKNKQNKTLVLAKTQTHGKGTRTRCFYSPKDQGIYLSYLLESDSLVHPITLVPLTMAAALLEVLKYYKINAQVKWVNDILIDNRKCAGILCESTNYGQYIIVGIGINVAISQFPKQLADIATSINRHTQQPINMNLFVGQLIQTFNRISTYPAVDMLQQYKRFCINLNKQALITHNNQLHQGLIRDIDKDVRLIFTSKEKEEVFPLVSTSQIINLFDD